MITLESLTVRLPGFTLGPLDLHVPRRGFYMLMGPTGSGKTLILESIAGIVRLTGGTVRVEGRDITSEKPGKRGVGIVYQDNSLFPHLSVRDNILYGKPWGRPGGLSLDRLADMLDIGRLLHRLPGMLSGGEKQRTALARALITNPGVLLLDEPMNSLDPVFRGDLRSELRRLHMKTETTFLMATHDFADALSLGTGGAVIRQGRVEQQGDIDDIFFSPETPFMASFVGMKNIFPVTFNGSVAITGDNLGICHTGEPRTGKGHIAVPPEAIVLARQPSLTSERNRFRGEVVSIGRSGFGFHVELVCGNMNLTAAVTRSALRELEIATGAAVWVSWKASAVHVF